MVRCRVLVRGLAAVALVAAAAPATPRMPTPNGLHRRPRPLQPGARRCLRRRGPGGGREPGADGAGPAAVGRAHPRLRDRDGRRSGRRAAGRSPRACTWRSRGEYLERHRFRDAQRELDEAIRLDARRREALTVRGLIEAQLDGRAARGARRLRARRRADARHPVRAYLHRPPAAGRRGPGDASRGRRAAVRRGARGGRAGARRRRRSSGSASCRKCRASSRSFRRPRIAPASRPLVEGRYEEAITRLRTAAALDPLVTPPAGIGERCGRRAPRCVTAIPRHAIARARGRGDRGAARRRGAPPAGPRPPGQRGRRPRAWPS